MTAPSTQLTTLLTQFGLTTAADELRAAADAGRLPRGDAGPA